MSFHFVFSAVLVVIFLSSTYATNGNTKYANCAFSEVGKSTCFGTGTTSSSNYLGYFLEGAENFALLYHPSGICILYNIDYVWFPSAKANLFGNGIFAYIYQVNDVIILYPGVGCGQPYYLRCDDTNFVPSTRTIRNSQVYKAFYLLKKQVSQSYQPPCNILPVTVYNGPSEVEVFNGANFIVDVSGLQSFTVYPQNGTVAQFKKGAESLFKAQKVDDVIIKEDKYALTFYQNSNYPRAPYCVPQKSDLSVNCPDVSAIANLKNGSACFLATTLAYALAAENNNYSGRNIFTAIAIFERFDRAITILEGYITNIIFDILFLTLYNFCR